MSSVLSVVGYDVLGMRSEVCSSHFYPEGIKHMDSVTVTVVKRRTGFPLYKLTFSALHGQTFGPWDFSEAVRDLTVSALLTPFDARGLVLAALDHGSATVSTARLSTG